jgi:hypothetical protein
VQSRDGLDELPDLIDRGNAPRPVWVRVLALVGAVACFILGVVGWLIPVITGLPFYAAGLVLLAVASNQVGGWVNRLERRLPHTLRLKLRALLHKR